MYIHTDICAHQYEYRVAADCKPEIQSPDTLQHTTRNTLQHAATHHTATRCNSAVSMHPTVYVWVYILVCVWRCECVYNHPMMHCQCASDCVCVTVGAFIYLLWSIYPSIYLFKYMNVCVSQCVFVHAHPLDNPGNHPSIHSYTSSAMHQLLGRCNTRGGGCVPALQRTVLGGSVSFVLVCLNIRRLHITLVSRTVTACAVTLGGEKQGKGWSAVRSMMWVVRSMNSTQIPDKPCLSNHQRRRYFDVLWRLSRSTKSAAHARYKSYPARSLTGSVSPTIPTCQFEHSLSLRLQSLCVVSL